MLCELRNGRLNIKWGWDPLVLHVVGGNIGSRYVVLIFVMSIGFLRNAHGSWAR